MSPPAANTTPTPAAAAEPKLSGATCLVKKEGTIYVSATGRDLQITMWEYR